MAASSDELQAFTSTVGVVPATLTAPAQHITDGAERQLDIICWQHMVQMSVQQTAHDRWQSVCFARRSLKGTGGNRVTA